MAVDAQRHTTKYVGSNEAAIFEHVLHSCVQACDGVMACFDTFAAALTLTG